MAIKFFADSNATQELSPTEYFIGNGVTANFVLTKFLASELSAVYVESAVEIAGVSFSAGTGSGTFPDPTVTSYLGMAVYHSYDASAAAEPNGLTCYFRGYVTSQTTTTLGISDGSYTAGADTLRLVSYVKKTAGIDYTVTLPSTITFVTAAPANLAKVFCLGSNTKSINFGGAVQVGDPVDSATLVFVSKDADYEYTDMQFYVDNLSQKLSSSSYLNATISAGVLTLTEAPWFPGVNSEVGKAVNDYNGNFIGTIKSNDTNSAVLYAPEVNSSTLAYSDGAQTVDTGAQHTVTVYSVGEFFLANADFAAADYAGKTYLDAGPYRKVLQGGVDSPGIPADLNSQTVYPIWVRGIIKVPENATNYAENVLRVAATEYLA